MRAARKPRQACMRALTCSDTQNSRKMTLDVALDVLMLRMLVSRVLGPRIKIRDSEGYGFGTWGEGLRFLGFD